MPLSEEGIAAKPLIILGTKGRLARKRNGPCGAWMAANSFMCALCAAHNNPAPVAVLLLRRAACYGLSRMATIPDRLQI